MARSLSNLFRRDARSPNIGGPGSSTGSGTAGRRTGAADLSNEVRDVIDAAAIMPREPNDDGPRTAVLSRSLRGSFIYTREEAERRIGLAFPDLNQRGIDRAARHLESRVLLAAKPLQEMRRPGWVHGWMKD